MIDPEPNANSIVAPANRLTYASFGRRLLAAVIDALIWAPVSIWAGWMTGQFRLFRVYYLAPGLLFSFWFAVYLVKRYGGTPGKLLARTRIRNLDGTPVSLKTACLRSSVELFLTAALTIGLFLMMISLSDAEFLALPRSRHGLLTPEALRAFIPNWYPAVAFASQLWAWSELIVMLTNKKRRALHDFIAGTVVVQA